MMKIAFDLDNTITASKQSIEFFEILTSDVDIPVTFWDERYTSVEANEQLKQMGYSIAESRKVIDKVAASIILKSYT